MDEIAQQIKVLTAKGTLCKLICIVKNRDEFGAQEYTKMLTISQQLGYNVHIVFDHKFLGLSKQFGNTLVIICISL
ncbi:hypothetical protein A6E27_02530 [Bacillus cereus]|nr:hypothetical protein COE56_29050 [Bacillus anthracis]RAS96894.1 hypothetical protein A6E21_03680 [Bacillus cereus]RAT10436.1 hypothetical protein A6E27_02530 [Bacillus cereus]